MPGHPCPVSYLNENPAFAQGGSDRSCGESLYMRHARGLGNTAAVSACLFSEKIHHIIAVCSLKKHGLKWLAPAFIDRRVMGVLSCVVLFSMLAPLSVVAAKIQIQQALDLRADGLEAKKRQVVLLLAVSQGQCPFCELLKREFLRPMLLSEAYGAKVMIQELVIDVGDPVRDFSGNLVDSAVFAQRYGVRLTPTLLFLDFNGKELTERILGINTPEMFGFYVDEAIEGAVSELRARYP